MPVARQQQHQNARVVHVGEPFKVEDVNMLPSGSSANEITVEV
jgi:hypothetical protein